MCGDCEEVELTAILCRFGQNPVIVAESSSRKPESDTISPRLAKNSAKALCYLARYEDALREIEQYEEIYKEINSFLLPRDRKVKDEILEGLNAEFGGLEWMRGQMAKALDVGSLLLLPPEIF